MITHHDVCFGCGQANLFGLQFEAEADPPGVRGRFFVKQDHQGPPGFAHGGIVAAALDEAMALALHAEGKDVRTRTLQVRYLAPIPVGVFVEIGADGGSAEARVDGKLVADASADFAVS